MTLEQLLTACLSLVTNPGTTKERRLKALQMATDLARVDINRAGLRANMEAEDVENEKFFDRLSNEVNVDS